MDSCKPPLAEELANFNTSREGWWLGSGEAHMEGAVVAGKVIYSSK